MDHAALKVLIDSDGSNAAKTDQQVLDWLLASVTSVYDTLSGDEIFGATDNTEFSTLTDHKQLLWLSFCGRSEIDPQGSSNVAFVNFIFGGGSTTISSIAAIRQFTEPRHSANGFAVPSLGDVIAARSL